MSIKYDLETVRSEIDYATGKSVLTSVLIRSLEDDPKLTVLYYFCNYYSTHGNKSSYLLRSLVAQLLRRNVELSSYVYEEYIQKGLSSSTRQLKKLITVLLTAEKNVRIVVDGVDEFPEKDQKQVISDLIPLASISGTGIECKILFSSRDIPPISKQLARYSTICLSSERKAIDAAIKSYICHNLTSLNPHFMDARLKDIMNSVEEELINKAQGASLRSSGHRTHSTQIQLTLGRYVPMGAIGHPNAGQCPHGYRFAACCKVLTFRP